MSVKSQLCEPLCLRDLVAILTYPSAKICVICGKKAKSISISDQDKYDFVFDAVGKSTFLKCKKLLKPGGVYISSELGPWWQNIWWALITPLFGKKKVIFPVPSGIKQSLAYIHKIMEDGMFKPVIDRTYSFKEISQAYEYVATGEKTGNVVIQWAEMDVK